MKYLDEFGDPDLARRLLAEIDGAVTRPWTLMEVCGGQTHAILRHGIDQVLPGRIELIHGPGCPVCVTPLATIERALAIAARPGVVFCSFGDMLRVPGRERDLSAVRAAGATSASSTRPSTPWTSPRPNPTARSSSSAWDSRPRRRPTPWPS